VNVAAALPTTVAAGADLLLTVLVALGQTRVFLVVTIVVFSGGFRYLTVLVLLRRGLNGD
jgi:hypothetical protein